MPLSAKDIEAGLIYLDAGRPADESATHVLVVGVGHYPRSEFGDLTSPTISARTVAGWFQGLAADGVTQLQDGFMNSVKPLGSLALLLSDPEPESSTATASFGSFTVPRATMANMKNAVDAWLLRARAHRDNMAILYLCGHGLLDEKHTAFVLEDRDDGDTNDVTNGLIDIDVFIGRLAKLPIRSQLLLFDCCRSETALGVPDGDQIGEAFIKPPASAGPDIQQMALFATLPKAVAAGLVNRASLFAESLLMALRHAGADRKGGSWVVDTVDLFSAVQDCLRLFARSEQSFQRIGANALASFPVHAPRISSTDVPTYVSLLDAEKWEASSITVKRSGAPDLSLAKVTGQQFISTQLQREIAVEFVADLGDGTTKALPAEPDRPVLFARIGEPSLSGVSVTSAPLARGLDNEFGESLGTAPSARAELSASLIVTATAGQAMPPPEGVVTVVSVSNDQEPQCFALRFLVPIQLKPGRFRVSLALPDGRTLTRFLELSAGQVATVNFETGSSPHEWLGTASAAGVVPIELRQLENLAGLPPPVIAARLLSPLGFNPAPEPADDVGAVLHVNVDREGPLARINIKEQAQSRFRAAADGSARERPLWSRVTVNGRTFDMALPAVGTNSPMYPHIVAVANNAELNVAALADAGAAAPLFAFLGRRDFVNAGAVLRALLEDDQERDRICDDKNALVSAAAAMTAIAVRGNFAVLDEDWHALFVRQHPSLPDAPVIAARRLWCEGRFSETKARIRELLIAGFEAGVPVFGLSLDWLADGLSLFSDDAECQAKRAKVRAFARRSIHSSLFTVLRSEASVFSLAMHPASEGDCATLLWGESSRSHRALVDLGRTKDYRMLLPELKATGFYDLFVITHVDADHIEGAMPFVREDIPSFDAGEVWFNAYHHLAEARDRVHQSYEIFSPAQGEKLSEGIIRFHWRERWNRAFGGGRISVDSAQSRAAIEFGGLQVRLLSPDDGNLIEMESRWLAEIKKAGLLPLDPDLVQPDEPGTEIFGPPDVEALAREAFREDMAVANGTSIAFLAEFEGKRVIMSGDAHPGVMAESLRHLGATVDNPIRVDLLKVSHHSSKANTSPEFLALVDCRRYAFSTDGTKNDHPDAQTVARILKQEEKRRETQPDRRTELIFNFRQPRTLCWDVASLKTKYHYECILPPVGQSGIMILI
ncbi:caspase family protein [Mesorhizobium sp.]|uniref:caspase family protein n=1 Tax=Mesorhizobium sp. TaxID=1871066 RepID=UPI000FE97F78|nr:caspase family protein [Mesorhizobium sp.]RWP51088.1 MAG: hypothetical protein EOR05_03990 [Mesorhizobium sp.]